MESFPSFFFFLCKCGGHRPGAWPALSMSHVSMTSSGMKRGEQSGSRAVRITRRRPGKNYHVMYATDVYLTLIFFATSRGNCTKPT